MFSKVLCSISFIFILFLVGIQPALAQTETPGSVFGTGTNFAVTDSEYLNVELTSDTEVTVFFESIPSMITIFVEELAGAAPVNFTLTGLQADTIYYQYDETRLSHVSFTTDASGSRAFVLDLSEPRMVFIQPSHSTYAIPADSTIGTWDPVTRVYTLTTDISEGIVVTEPDLTLEGAGHTITGAGTGFGIYRKGFPSYYGPGITVKNLTISNFSSGIGFHNFSRYNTVTNVTITNCFKGVDGGYLCIINTIMNNLLKNNATAISTNMYGNGWIISGNYIVNNGTGTGIFLYNSSNNTVKNNIIAKNGTGLVISSPSYDPSSGNQVYNNDFLENTVQISYYVPCSYFWCNDNDFNHDLPDGGNYWSDHLSPDTDNDGIVDTPYVFTNGQDSLPWAHRLNTPGIPSNTVIGTWDPVTRIYTLKTDVLGEVIFEEGNITLEGAGHSITGFGDGTGLYWHHGGGTTANAITIRNLSVSNFTTGIYFYWGCAGNIVDNVTVSDCAGGIIFHYGCAQNSVTNCTLTNNTSRGIGLGTTVNYTLISNNILTGNHRGIGIGINNNNNTVTANQISGCTNDGIFLDRSQYHTVTDNVIRNCGYGIRIDRCGNHSIHGNTVIGNSTGISITGTSSSYSQIYHNDFLCNSIQAVVGTGVTGNVFNLDLPDGGNYWSDHVSPDADQDNIVDDPYVFTGGEDDLPWAYVRNPISESPVAEAGDAQSAMLGDTVTLDGSGSYDDNTPSENLVYAWSFSSIPAGSSAVLTGADTISPSFTVDMTGDYIIQLVVNDGECLVSSPDEVTVSALNTPPNANAGNDLGTYVGYLVQLDGSGSYDPDGDPITYTWTMTEQPVESTAALSGADTVNASFTPDMVGTYRIELVVDDGYAQSSPDVVIIMVVSPEDFAQEQTGEALTGIASLPETSVTTTGNQTSLENTVTQVIQAIQQGHINTARNKLEQALEHTDGCVLRGAPDGPGGGGGNPPAQDYITDCAEQLVVYQLLIDALAALE